MKITKVNAEDFSAERLRTAVAATKNNQPLQFVAENGNQTEIYKINYRGGLRYPHLERDTAKADVLSQVTKPSNGFIFQSSSSIRTSRRPSPAPNGFANVTELALNQTEMTASGKQTIDVSTVAVDPENDVLIYLYTVSGGRIVGTGPKVVWDLTGVKLGEYTITAGVDDGCGVCGRTQTRTVKVTEIPKSN
jgi:hypothetical protein